MASSTRLFEGWTLTDGVFAPFSLTHPMDIPSALRERGLIAKSPSGSGFLHEEWIYRRTFKYRLKFSLPEESHELWFLQFDSLIGGGHILLNGGVVWGFDAGESSARFPINPHMRDGENELEVLFYPDHAEPRRAFGILGGVSLIGGHSLIVSGHTFTGMRDKIIADVRLEALAEGKYIFKYNISLADEVVCNIEHIERLCAISEAKLTHELPIPAPVRFDGDKPDDTAYVVRLGIERMGIGCALVRGRAALTPEGESGPLRVVELPAEHRMDERALSLMRELGADALLIHAPNEHGNHNMAERDAALLHGLLPLPEADRPEEVLTPETAILPYAALERLAGDMTFWPSEQPLWKLLGADPIDRQRIERLFGTNATGDAGRCIRLSRALQAEKLFLAAAEARRKGIPMLLRDPIEPAPTPASAAIVEHDCAKRPAFQALQAAWARRAAYVGVPDGLSVPAGSSIRLPIRYIAEADLGGELMTLSCECLSGSGQLLSSAAIVVLAPGQEPLGELPIDLPEAACVLTIRCRLTDSLGETAFANDQLLCVALPGQPPLAALMTEYPAQVAP